jgi:hypothetical protein
MSSFDFKIQYPSIPSPRISDDMGIAPIREAAISQSGSSGIGSFDISPPAPPRLSDSHHPARRYTGTVTSDEPTEEEYKTAIEAVYSAANTKPVNGDLITLNTSTEFNTRLFIYSTNDSAPDIATIQFEIDGETESATEWYAYNFIGGASSGLSLVEVQLANGSELVLSVGAAMASYDPASHVHWSIAFEVTNGKFTGNVTYDSTEAIYGYDGSGDQNKYRLRLITELIDGQGASYGAPISAYGQYREVTLCKNGEPVQSLIKIS